MRTSYLSLVTPQQPPVVDLPLVDKFMTSLQNAQREAAAFAQDAVAGRYDGLMQDVRNFQRNALVAECGLSSRETEVFYARALGYQNKQVAFALSISEVTVKIHTGRVMKKLTAALGYPVNNPAKLSAAFWGISRREMTAVEATQPKLKAKPNEKRLEG